MADFVPPRIGSISDPNSGSPDEAAPKKPRVKAAPAASAAPPPLPKISSAEEEEQDRHELDELA
jgi:hypothetical protein